MDMPVMPPSWPPSRSSPLSPCIPIVKSQACKATCDITIEYFTTAGLAEAKLCGHTPARGSAQATARSSQQARPDPIRPFTNGLLAYWRTEDSAV